MHGDAGIRNLCLIPTSERKLQFVLLDFTCPSSIPYDIAHDLEWADAELSFLYDLYEELGEKVVVDWLQTDIGKRFESLCRMSPQELAVHDPLPNQM